MSSNVNKITEKILKESRGDKDMTKLAEGSYTSRINTDGYSIYYDLCNKNNECIQINKQGINLIYDFDSEFNKHNNQQQVMPDYTNGNIELLRKFINLSAEDWFLYKIQLISSLIPNIVHPISCIIGESGRGKSIMNLISLKIIEPSFVSLGLNENISNMGDYFITLMNKNQQK